MNDDHPCEKIKKPTTIYKHRLRCSSRTSSWDGSRAKFANITKTRTHTCWLVSFFSLYGVNGKMTLLQNWHLILTGLIFSRNIRSLLWMRCVRCCDINCTHQTNNQSRTTILYTVYTQTHGTHMKTLSNSKICRFLNFSSSEECRRDCRPNLCEFVWTWTFVYSDTIVCVCLLVYTTMYKCMRLAL